MNDLSIHRALARGQRRWDGMELDDDYSPASMANLLELQQENFKLRDQLTQLLEEARDGGDKLNRIQCCAGDRLLRRCNEIEGIEDGE